MARIDLVVIMVENGGARLKRCCGMMSGACGQTGRSRGKKCRYYGKKRRKLPNEPRTYTTKHGTTATMNTANIGRTPRPGCSCEQDPVTLRQGYPATLCHRL